MREPSADAGASERAPDESAASHGAGVQGADLHYLRRALALAARGLNTTDPNPRVGCVLVSGDRVIGEGWHERAGGAHAEVNALRMAGPAAAGATAYVTLEPCVHMGRTPPCVDALAAARVRRVLYAARDPNPLVNGAGVAALRAHGIEVIGEVLPEEARALNPGFFKRMQAALPWVRVKLAMSLDGRTALANGASRWISGEAARRDVQHFRARSSVILTGSSTVLSDDPALDVRLEGAVRQPLRVVLDRTLRVSPQARVFTGAGAAMVFTASADQARRAQLERAGVSVESAASDGSGLDLELVLRRLAELEANEIWVEAGARLAGALLQARLVDELILYVAPALLGPSARALVELPQIEHLESRLRLQFIDCARVGEDLRISARPLLLSGAVDRAAEHGAEPAASRP